MTIIVRSLLALFVLAAGTAASAPQPQLDLGAYRGKVVVVDFWASWCKPCRQSIPWLNQLRARHGANGLVIIGVNVDADRADAERFLREVPIEFEIFYDPTGSLAARFDVQGMPSSFVFDRDGKLVSTHLGYRQKQRDQHESEILSLLSRDSP